MNICVTGTIGAGKSRVVHTLSRLLGCQVTSADTVARGLMQIGNEGYSHFLEKFNGEYLLANREIDRLALRKLIARDADKKKLLENILHPLIKQTFRNTIEAVRETETIHLYEVPLLFEVGWQEPFDVNLVVHVQYREGRRRLMMRDNLDKKMAESLLKLHFSSCKKAMLADAVIDNTGAYSRTSMQLLQFARSVRAGLA